ncbi:chromosome associated protein H2 isoform X2 [Rhodnius prolixus]
MDKDPDGFETLLRPVRDAITANWNKTIKSYLEKYLEHLCGHNSTNFSEAALILQNSMKFYCKRIDLLYNDLLNFIMYINDVGSREEGVGASVSSKRGKRCIVKSFHNDDFHALGCVHLDQGTSINLDNIGKNGIGKKSVVLNPSVKIPIKSGTSCQIYQSDGKELGYKDEFRLFWPISSLNGLLSEDINIRGQSLERFSGSILEDTSNYADNCMENGCEDSYDNDLELQPESFIQQTTKEPSDLRPISPSFPSPPQPPAPVRTLRQERKKENIRKKIVDWEPISFNFVFPQRKLKVRKAFKLPQQLIEEVMEKRKKRKRDNQLADTSSDVLVLSNLLYQNEILGDACDGIKFKYNMAKKSRNCIMMKNRLKGIELNGDINHEEDEVEDDYAEAIYSDPESDRETSSTVPLQLNGLTDIAEDRDRIDTATSYLATAVQVIAEYHALKKQISSRSTELTKRVSEWHESIMPALEAAESRSIFNVHEYGTKILDNFSDNDNKTVLKFDNLVKNQPKEEICRYLLSSLMLANTYNVDILKSDNRELANDCLQLRLLSKVRHHEVLNENIGATAADSHC